MTAQLLSSELANLIQESKRKNTELRTAAEQSLNDLRALPATSEAQLAADLNRRPNFVRPFLVACGTRNAKYAGSAIVCLQRLVVSNGLAKESLKEVLEAFRECSSLGLDIQLKILQALPSLLQNYASSLTGDFLGATLQVCCLLHGSKTAVVSNTAAATLQQLVVSVLDKVAEEDFRSSEVPTVAEVQTGNGDIAVRTAALDAYRLLNDLCLLTEGRKADFLQTAPLPQNFGLELLESILTNHVDTVLSHPEQIHVLRVRLVPFIIKILSERLNFATSVRAMRILHLVFKRMLTALASECEMALSLFNHMLDPEAAVTWKRALCLEIWRSVHSEPALVRTLYSLYDEQDGKGNILQDHMSGLVRLAVEKPAAIGLGQHSTVPASLSRSDENSGEQAAMQAGGVAGTIGAPVGMIEPNAPGISMRWSTIRVSCLDQLDKSDAPTLPVAYIYGLALACVNSFSEGLARFLLPLTMSSEAKGKKKQRIASDADQKKSSPPPDADTSAIQMSRTEFSRQQSSRGLRLPVNPLDLERHPLYSQIRTSAHIVDKCWPALLATCSTFLNAALDSDFYHALVRSFQKFTQVAGILCLSTPRDAFLTTLGKHAVPSALGAAHTIGSPIVDGRSHARRVSESPSSDSLASSIPSTPSERARQSIDLGTAILNTRNLLCLRALLNLGIALGPTLQKAWSIILETLLQADLIISVSMRSNQYRVGYNNKSNGHDSAEDPSIQGNLAAEINAVDTATSRMFESTSDLPDEAFLDALNSLSSLIRNVQDAAHETSENSAGPSFSSRSVSQTHRRMVSSTGGSTAGTVVIQSNNFVLDKLGDIVRQNIIRLQKNEVAETGWNTITETLVSIVCASNMGNDIRMKAAQILNGLIIAVATSTSASPNVQDEVRRRALTCLRCEISSLYSQEPLNPNLSSLGCEIEIHQMSLRALTSILEQCGDSIGLGWDIVFTIISSVFVEQGPNDATVCLEPPSAPVSRSSKLVRSAFGSLQLICSDFISYLPQLCFPILLDTLYSFCSQEDDFNISLTTTTFFWNVSDFLQGRIESFHLNGSITKARNEVELIKLANTQDSSTSSAALWLCLLLRLKAMTTDSRLEVRHGAVHTTFRIFDACGNQLSSSTWGMCLELIILDMLHVNEMRYQGVKSSRQLDKDGEQREWNETAIVLLGAVARLIEQFSETIIAMNDFPTPWRTLLQSFSHFLRRGSLDVDAASFVGLAAILSKIDNVGRVGIPSIDMIWNLWMNNFPSNEELPPSDKAENQPALMAYLRCLREIYRLVEQTLLLEQVRVITGQLRLCMTESSMTYYSSDVEALTTLQTEVLKCVKIIRTDVPDVPSVIIDLLAFFVALAYRDEDKPPDRQRPTFVALSKAAMDILSKFILTHVSNKSIYASGALTRALSAFAVPINMKYRWPLEGKDPATWKKATGSARSVLESCVPVLRKIRTDTVDVSAFWEEVIKITDGIVDADCDLCPTPSSISVDQDFDAQAFTNIRDFITPALGSANIPDRIRRKHAESIFNKSIIHAPHPDDLPRSGQEPLENLRSIHIGRVQKLPPSPRAKLCYILLDELFNLVAVSGSSPERVKLAQAAAPFLILRAGITLKAYILDQPLRGLRPQPLSQRRELLYILKKLAGLDSEPKAIPEAPGVVSAHKKHLHRIYPLVTRAVGVASRDEEVLAALERVLEVVGEGFGV